MTLNEYEQLTDTDRAFLKLEGRCDGCGCQIANQIYIVHGEWCSESPALRFTYNWDRGSKKIVTNTSRRQGKSVFANMIKAFNKIRNKDENTNS
jgi:hypothetical protein